MTEFSRQVLNLNTTFGTMSDNLAALLSSHADALDTEIRLMSPCAVAQMQLMADICDTIVIMARSHTPGVFIQFYKVILVMAQSYEARALPSSGEISIITQSVWDFLKDMREIANELHSRGEGVVMIRAQFRTAENRLTLSELAKTLSQQLSSVLQAEHAARELV